MENKIKQLYKFVFDKAREVQHKTLKDEQIDGKAVWNSIEVKIKDIKLDMDLKYNDSLYELYEKMDKIIEKYDLASNEFNPITNHYFLQLKNLVKTKSNFIIYINRVLQIAYNAGQLSVLLENNKLNDDITQFTLQNNMLDLDTYVSTDNQNIINMKIHDHIISDVVNDSNANSIQKGGNLYKLKYLKYKQKYLELKKILLGGVDVDLTVLYANVGADNVYGIPPKPSKPDRPAAYCQQTGTRIKDYEHRNKNFSRIDPIEISKLSLYNLKIAIDKLIEQDINVLMFCEFCFSQLHALIEYLNKEKDREYKYDILLIGQKRDDNLYDVIEESGVQKTNDRDRIAINGYHPDAKTAYKSDGYFKCFGYIYKKDKLRFNNAKTLIQNRLDNSSNDFYDIKIDKIDTLSGQHIYIGGNPTNTDIPVERNLHISKIYDYKHTGYIGYWNKLSNKYIPSLIVECITQFSGLANFTVGGKSIWMFVPHFSGTIKDTHWNAQYINLLKRMQILETNNKIIMIGDFNVRIESDPTYYNTIKHSIPPTNALHSFITQVSGENTLYLNKYMQISPPDIITQPKLNDNFVSAHKFIKLTLRIPDVEQPVVAVPAAEPERWVRPRESTQPAQPAQPLPHARQAQPTQPAQSSKFIFKEEKYDLKNIDNFSNYVPLWIKVCNIVSCRVHIQPENLREIRKKLTTIIKEKIKNGEIV